MARLKNCRIKALGLVAPAYLLLLIQIAPASTIGPDVFGYTATNAIYSYIDISATGTNVLAGLTDNFAGPISLGFPFVFYGTTYTQVYLSSDGALTFTAGTADFNNVDFQYWAPPGDMPMIAPMWDSLSTPNGIYYQTIGSPGNEEFVYQFFDGAYCCNPVTPSLNFEAILFQGTNRIEFQYQNVVTGDPVNDYGNYATIGIRNTGGQANGSYLEWSFAQPVISNVEAIQFADPPSSPLPEPASWLLAGSALLYLGWKRLQQS